MAVISMSTQHKLLLIFLIFALIGTVSADSDYCTPSSGTITDIVIEGSWANITIESESCPICVVTAVGLECSECPYTPTPTPTPCVPAPGVWCPVGYYPTPTPTPPPCFLIWCPAPTPSITPTPTPTMPCPIGEWCPL